MPSVYPRTCRVLINALTGQVDFKFPSERLTQFFRLVQSSIFKSCLRLLRPDLPELGPKHRSLSASFSESDRTECTGLRYRWASSRLEARRSPRLAARDNGHGGRKRHQLHKILG